MANYTQRSAHPIVQITCKNTGTAISAYDAVQLDASDSDMTYIAVKKTTAAGGMDAAFGIALANIAVSGVGPICVVGTAPAVCHGTITRGDFVQLSDTVAHLGQIKTLDKTVTAEAQSIIGKALQTGADTDTIEILVLPAPATTAA